VSIGPVHGLHTPLIEPFKETLKIKQQKIKEFEMIELCVFSRKFSDAAASTKLTFVLA